MCKNEIIDIDEFIIYPSTFGYEFIKEEDLKNIHNKETIEVIVPSGFISMDNIKSLSDELTVEFRGSIIDSESSDNDNKSFKAYNYPFLMDILDKEVFEQLQKLTSSDNNNKSFKAYNYPFLMDILDKDVFEQLQKLTSIDLSNQQIVSYKIHWN